MYQLVLTSLVKSVVANLHKGTSYLLQRMESNDTNLVNYYFVMNLLNELKENSSSAHNVRRESL
jgi:hypothetical protein